MLIALPEATDYILSTSSTMEVNKNLVREFPKRMAALAKECNVYLSFGYHELPQQDSTQTHEKHYNSHAIVSPAGDIIANYRKIHLFDAMVDNGFKESTKTKAGDKVCIVRNTPIGNIGVSTCYDVRFPEMFVAMGDCSVILVPSAFAMATGLAHWEVLLRARAIETQAYVVAAAQVGKHDAFRESYGHSLIVDPWGKVIYDGGANNGSIDSVQIGYADIDHALISGVREKMPIALHRNTASNSVTVEAKVNIVNCDDDIEKEKEHQSDSKRLNR